MNNDHESYNINEHRHRCAVWTAGRSAQRGHKGLTIEVAKDLIESAHLRELLEDPSKLPSPTNVDSNHREWRISIEQRGIEHHQVKISHGLAAKLINVYFKIGLVCGGYHNLPSVCALHPPIDSILLENMSEREFGKRTDWHKRAWSKLGSAEYQLIIDQLRTALKENPMWSSEAYWTPYRRAKAGLTSPPQ